MITETGAGLYEGVEVLEFSGMFLSFVEIWRAEKDILNDKFYIREEESKGKRGEDDKGNYKKMEVVLCYIRHASANWSTSSSNNQAT